MAKPKKGKQWDFDKIIETYKKEKKKLPVQVANIARNQFLQAFEDGGFTDRNFVPWAPRKTRGRTDRKNRGRRALLVDTGALRNSIRIRKANFVTIAVGAQNVRYARRHNRGEKIVQRKFVGKSFTMNKEISKKIGISVDKSFKK
jgi:phage gpG-like protein